MTATLKIGKGENEKVIKLTEAEFDEIVYCVKTHILWESGGCYGDGDDIADKKGFATAKRALKKLS